MELSSLEVQIFISLAVVLGTAFVALVCDFLKGNNERLREKNVELQVRQQERERTAIQDPVTWLHDLATVLRHPQTGRLFQQGRGAVVTDHPAAAPPPKAAPQPKEEIHPPADTRHVEPVGGRRDAPEEPLAGAVPVEPPVWASRDELQMAAQRAARIRARHHAAESKVAVPVAEPTYSPDPEVPARPRMSAEPPPSAAPAFSGLETFAPAPVAAPLATPRIPQAEPADTAGAVMMPEDPEVVADERPPVEIAHEIAHEKESPFESSVAADPSSETASVEVLPIAADRYEPIVTVERSVDQEVPEVAVRETAASDEAPAEAEIQSRQDVDDGPSPLPPEVTARYVVEESFEQPAILEPAAAEVGAAGAPVVESAVDFETAAPELEDSSPQMLTIPAGLDPGGRLSLLMESSAPFSGVVVAIGINDYEVLKARTSAPELTASLTELIDTMLRERDFACRFAEDEYILLYPGETGSSAQRRLYQVSEKLWDYQLRSLGNYSVMFSWGGLEVQRESVADAVTSARERMFQTKRNRSRTPPRLGVSGGPQMVVNG